MLTLDVGCGWQKGSHNKRGDVGLDLYRGMCDVLGDAQFLPFRDEIFDRVLLYYVLEHLDSPSRCLKEVKRVAKKGAYVKILIPAESRSFRTMLKMLFVEFPFSIPLVIRLMWRTWAQRKHEIRGGGHKNRIQPRHISPFLEIESVQVRDEFLHSWFVGLRGKLMKRIIKKPPKGVWKIYYITARTENNGD